MAGVRKGRGRELGRETTPTRSQAPKFNLPLSLLTPATQAIFSLLLLTLGVEDSLLLPLFYFSGIDVSSSKRLSPTPSVSNLSLTPCRYLSTVTRSSSQGSVDGFRRERLQRLATFASLSVQRRLEARSRMESRTIVSYLDGIYGLFPSVDPSGRFA